MFSVSLKVEWISSAASRRKVVPTVHILRNLSPINPAVFLNCLPSFWIIDVPRFLGTGCGCFCGYPALFVFSRDRLSF